MLSEIRQEKVKQLREFVDNCKFETEADVEKFFEVYTNLIWDYKMISLIYDNYTDETIIHGENGVDMSGIDAVVGHTVERLFTLPDMKIRFICIHASKVSDDEYKFIQVTYPEGTYTGPSKYGQPNGKKLNYDNIMNMCECLVKRVNGKWAIVEEWGLLGYEKFFNGDV